MGLMDCGVVLQGLHAQLLIPDERVHLTDGTPDEPDTLGFVKNMLNPEDLYHIVGGEDPVYPFVSLLGMHLPPGSLMVDIGTDVGTWVLIISKFFPDVQIIGVEANPWMAALANENMRRNNVSDRVRVINAGLTGDGRNITLRGSTFPLRNSAYDVIYPETVDLVDGWEYVVPSLTFSQLLQQVPDRSPAFLKIDCEGCESEVLDHIEGLTIPYIMECHEHVKAMASRSQLDQCYGLTRTGVERLFLNAAWLKGCPVMYAAALLETSDGTIVSKYPKPTLRSGESILQELPEGLARWQYAALLKIAPRMGDFHLASALEMGHGITADLNASVLLFLDVAAAPGAVVLAEGAQDEGKRLLDFYAPVLESMKTAAMFRAGLLLKRAGYGDEARDWLSQAASRGHMLAYTELALSRGEVKHGVRNQIAKDGHYPAYPRASMMSRIHMESLGLPPTLQLLLLNAEVSSQFDPCIRNHQESRIPAWHEEHENGGRQYGLLEGYRFRSWWHSAMVCWLEEGQHYLANTKLSR